MTQKFISTDNLYRMNIIGVKVVNQERTYRQTIGEAKVKTIKRTSYLKVCWMCGSVYESNRYSSHSCSARCANNIAHARKKGFNPPAKMDLLTKEKNTRDAKERFGYL